jgi:hypothetical protein
VRIVRVPAHERGEVERDGKAGLPVLQEVLVPLVRVLRRAEAGELPHCPEFSAVHVLVHSPRVGVFARESDVREVIDVGDVVGRVEDVDRFSGHRGEFDATCPGRVGGLPGPVFLLPADLVQMFCAHNTLPVDVINRIFKIRNIGYFSKGPGGPVSPWRA